jgi:hypothetical protein
MDKNASGPIAPYIPKDITPFILDNLVLPDVIQYYQMDKTSKNSIGTPLDIASLYGLPKIILLQRWRRKKNIFFAPLFRAATRRVR